MSNKKKFLIELDNFNKGDNYKFCCRTVLVSATDKDKAFLLAKKLKPNDKIGRIKEVYY